MLNKKRLAYLSQYGILNDQNNSFTTIIGCLTLYNLYKVEILKAVSINTIPISMDINFSYIMIADISK